MSMSSVETPPAITAATDTVQTTVSENQKKPTMKIRLRSSTKRGGISIG